MTARIHMDSASTRLLQANSHTRAPHQVQTRRSTTAAPVASSTRPGALSAHLESFKKSRTDPQSLEQADQDFGV